MLLITKVFPVFTAFLVIAKAQFLCPGNLVPFDYQKCDPELRSECPSGFTCRLATNNSTGVTENLCCESGRMTISDWFSDKNLTPSILPQAPYSLINTVQLAPASTYLNFPPVRVGDELVVISAPSFITGIVQSVSTTNFINPGYIHVVTVVEPQYKPFAVLLNYNIIVGQPSQSINVTASQRFVAYLDNTVSVPKQESYRSLYMVLIYYTTSQISLDGGNTPQEMLLGSCTDAKCLFASSPLTTKIGQQPLAGTLFYITTKNTVFATGSTGSSSELSTSNTLSHSIFLVFSIVFCALFC